MSIDTVSLRLESRLTNDIADVYWSEYDDCSEFDHLFSVQWFAPEDRGSLHLDFGGTDRWRLKSGGAPVKAVNEEVLVLCLRFVDDVAAWIASIDWSAIAQTVSCFLRLQRIIVVAENTDSAAAYKQHAHRHLEQLSREQNLEYLCSSELSMTDSECIHQVSLRPVALIRGLALEIRVTST